MFGILSSFRDEDLFDAASPTWEQLPRRFRVRVQEVCDGAVPVALLTLEDGRQLGDWVTDDADPPDGYRFHDSFHLACASILGWSPVTRRNMRCKRRHDPRTDQIEDGGRAVATEEGISQLVFCYAQDNHFLEGLDSVDPGLIRTIKRLTINLEVSVATELAWQEVILQAYVAMRGLLQHRGGYLIGDLLNRRLDFKVRVLG